LRVIIWAAVSTKPQLAGDSLEAQIRDAEAVCERFGWQSIATLKVPGRSRDFIFFQDAAEEIAAYRQFQALCENGSADVLVCRGRDRLGRTDALIAQVEALAQKASIQIYSIAMPSAIVDREDAHQDRGALYAAAIERASAQAEMIELRRRHQMGMRARIRRGLHANSPPYGYTRDNSSPVFVQVAQECEILRKIVELYLAGWGYKRIAAYLNDRGIPSAQAGQWQTPNLRKLLHNPFYAGWVSYGDIVEPGKHEPIFSPQEWTALRTEHARRKQTRGKAILPYTGLVRCCVCKRSMAASTLRYRRADGSETVYRYYRCTEGQARGAEHRPEKHHTQARVEIIREAILAKVEQLQDPEVLEAACRDVALEQRRSLSQQKVSLENSLERLSREISRLLEAYSHWESLSMEEFDKAITQASNHKKALEENLLAVNLALEDLPDPKVRAIQLRELATDISPILDSPDIEEANAWLSKRIKTIWCEGNKVKHVEFL